MVINEPESEKLEFKSARKGKLPTNIWTTISAFANTDGGRIILGVDDNGEEIGLNWKELDKLEKDVVSLCDGKFNHRIMPIVKIEGNHVVVLIEPIPATMRPLYAKRQGIANGTYVRVGSADVKATGDDIRHFAVAAQGGAELFSYNVDYKEVLDPERIQSYIDLLNSKNSNIYQDFSVEEILTKQRALVDGKVTLFGLLAFGRLMSLQEIVSPAINIVVTQYAGTDKVEDLNSVAYIDSRAFNGPIIQQFDDAFNYIKSKLPIIGVIGENGIRQDYLVIPEIAIREALANAVVHRDYATTGARIQVDIYADRIEIINPGRSLMAIEDLESTQSITRNPLVMNFFQENGYTEQKARGIRTIKRSLREAGLKEPIFENLSSYSFKATLFTSSFFSKEDIDWLNQFRSYKLKDRQLNALVYMRNYRDAGISNSEYRSINSMATVGDDKMANRELNQLVSLGLAEKRGMARHTRYYLKNSE